MQISKLRTAALTAALMTAAFPALPNSANAAWGWGHHGWGWGGFGVGLAAGALVGTALAAPYYGGYYGYGYPAYGYGDLTDQRKAWVKPLSANQNPSRVRGVASA